MKFRFAAGQQQDLQRAFLSLGESRSFQLRMAPVGRRELHLHRPAAVDLDSVVKRGVGRQAVGPEAGARIIDLQQADRSAGAVLHGHINMRGMARRQRPDDRQCKGNKESLEEGWPGAWRLKPETCSHSSAAFPAAASFSATRFSKRSRRRSSSGSRWKMATARSHTRLSNPGEPEIIFPAGTSCDTADCAVRITPSPREQWPATPAWPARMALLPITDEPARPTCAHSSVFSPTRDPWPTCTRLSTLVPSPISVAPTVARSTHALACTSTRLPSRTGPDCGIFSHWPASFLEKPNPSAPITAPFSSVTWSPRVHPSRTTACACAKKWLPACTPG